MRSRRTGAPDSRRSCWSARLGPWIPAPLTISARWPIFRAASISGSTWMARCGALAILAPDLAPRLSGIERADSLAFDFHKWGQVPYDAGFVLVRDGVLHRKAFATSAAYLAPRERGLAGGSPWPCDFGPDLSRGFRALKIWFTLKVYGVDALGRGDFAHLCPGALSGEPHPGDARTRTAGARGTEYRLFPLSRAAMTADRVNARIVADLHEAEMSRHRPPSSTVRLAIRAAIVNHRTGRAEIDTLVEKTVAAGRGSTEAARKPPGKSDAQEWMPRTLREARLRELEAQIGADAEAILVCASNARACWPKWAAPPTPETRISICSRGNRRIARR